MDQSETHKRYGLDVPAAKDCPLATASKANSTFFTCVLAAILTAGMVIWIMTLLWGLFALSVWIWNAVKNLLTYLM